MKFEQCSFERFDGKGYKKTKNFMFLEKFMNSGLPCVIVTEHNYANASSCENALRKSVERFHMNDILVRIYNGEVFLIRKSELEAYRKRHKTEGQ